MIQTYRKRLAPCPGRASQLVGRLIVRDSSYNENVNHAKFRIGLVQMSCSPEPDENLAKAEERVREAAGRGAQIVCLQELFRSQYFCREEDARLFDLAEPIPGPTTERLGRVAKQQNVVIVAS